MGETRVLRLALLARDDPAFVDVARGGNCRQGVGGFFGWGGGLGAAGDRAALD